MATRARKTKMKTPTKTRAVVVEEEFVAVTQTPKPLIPRWLGWVILAAILLGLFWYKTNTWPVAAFVNGRPIIRYTVDQELFKQGGQQVLDNIITDQLVKQELARNKVTASGEEIDARIAEIKTSLGTSFDQALAAQGLSMEQLRKQVETQIKVEKLLENQATSSASEVEQMMKDGNMAATEAAQLVKQQKLQDAIQTWITSIRAKAKIVTVGQK